MKIGKFFFRITISFGRNFSDLFRDKEKSNVKLLPANEPSDSHEAKVWQVLDGDTVIVMISGNKVTIRLSSIDCPENGQDWGEVAKAGLIKLIGGRYVHLETYGTDCYGRTLATIFVKQGTALINVNERMVMLGHAWVMRMYYDHLPSSRRDRLDRLEKWAQSKRVGLWKTNNPIPPWEWRKGA